MRKISAASGIKNSSVHLIWKKDLHLKPYKIQEAQELKEGNDESRLAFCLQVMDMIESEELNIGYIIFIDESHIYLKSSPNKQNQRDWRDEKPVVRSQVPLHSPKVTVWCGMSSTKMFGPYFF